MPIDLTQPVALLKSDGSLLQLALEPTIVTQLLANEWATDVTERDLPSHLYATHTQNYAVGDGVTTTFDFTLDYIPVSPSSLALNPAQGGQSYGSNYAGQIIRFPTPAVVGSVNYQTGVVSVTFPAAPANGLQLSAFYLASSSAAVSYPINAIQLNNEMLDFIFGYSTKRVSPYDTDPYDGFVENVGSVPSGYSQIQAYTTDVSKTITNWLIVKQSDGSFMLYDKPKDGYLPYDYGLYGPPRVSGPLNVESTTVTNPYFSAIGRSTTDLFPAVLSNGISPEFVVSGEAHFIPIYNASFLVQYVLFGNNYNDSLAGDFVADLGVAGLTPVNGEFHVYTKVSTITERFQYTVNADGRYQFHAQDAGFMVGLSHTWRTLHPPAILAGAIVPEDEEDPAVDETATGVPENPTQYSWIFDDTGNPYTDSTALADALVYDFPIVDAGTGYAAGDVVGIIGGGQAKVLTVGGSGEALTARLWVNTIGQTTGTKTTTGGGGTGLTLAATVVGASREKPVTLTNPEGPKVWDWVTGEMVPSVVMTHQASGKSYLVPATNEISNPATGPLNLKFPLDTVDDDNSTLAAEIRALGIDPAPTGETKTAIGYSVEDNAFSILSVKGRQVSSCNPLPAASSGAYNFSEHIFGVDLYRNCYASKFEWDVTGVAGGGLGAGYPGCPSEAADGNIAQSVVDLAADMEAAGVDADELPALANILASEIIASPRPWFWPDSWEWPIGGSGATPPLILGANIPGPGGLAAATTAMAALAMRTLSTARSAIQYGEVYDDIGRGLVKYFPRITQLQALANFERGTGGTLLDGTRIMMDVVKWFYYPNPVPGLPTGEYIVVPTPVTLIRPVPGFPVTAENGFYNPNAGLDRLNLNMSNNSKNSLYWNPLNANLNKLLSGGPPANTCWFFGSDPNYNAMPMLVHTPGLPAPGIAPVGKFDSATNTMVMGRFPPDFNMRAHVCP